MQTAGVGSHSTCEVRAVWDEQSDPYMEGGGQFTVEGVSPSRRGGCQHGGMDSLVVTGGLIK